MTLETKIVIQKDGSEKYVDGYFLTLDQIKKLVIDYCSESFVSNDEIYIENWINKNC